MPYFASEPSLLMDVSVVRASVMTRMYCHVDPVLLACTFKGNEDERIEMSIKKLLAL